MPVPVIELAKAVRSALATQTGKPWERRYVPYFERSELASMKYLVGLAGDELGTVRRQLQDGELSIVLGFQQALPEVSDRDDEFIENETWLDARMQEVHDVKSLFLPGGSMRDLVLSSCEFKSMRNDPLYSPLVLLQSGIFQSTLELTYVMEHEG